MNNSENCVPFAVFCPDGFEPQLTLCSIQNGKGEQKTGLLGSGTKNNLIQALTGSIEAVLNTGIIAPLDVVVAILTAAECAKVDIDDIFKAFEAAVKSRETIKKLSEILKTEETDEQKGN